MTERAAVARVAAKLERDEARLARFEVDGTLVLAHWYQPSVFVRRGVEPQVLPLVHVRVQVGIVIKNAAFRGCWTCRRVDCQEAPIWSVLAFQINRHSRPRLNESVVLGEEVGNLARVDSAALLPGRSPCERVIDESGSEAVPFVHLWASTGIVLREHDLLEWPAHNLVRGAQLGRIGERHKVAFDRDCAAVRAMDYRHRVLKVVIEYG